MKEIRIRCNRCKCTIPDGTTVFGMAFIENGNSQPLKEVDLCPECVSKMKKELLHVVNQAAANDTVTNNSQNKIQKQQESVCDKDRKQKAIQLIKEGKSNKEISDILGSTTNYVAVIRHELKVNGTYTPEKKEPISEQKQEVIQEKEPAPVPPPTVSKKLDTAKIKALLHAGWSMEKIARTEFHCTTAEIKEALEKDH